MKNGSPEDIAPNSIVTPLTETKLDLDGKIKTTPVTGALSETEQGRVIATAYISARTAPIGGRSTSRLQVHWIQPCMTVRKRL